MRFHFERVRLPASDNKTDTLDEIMFTQDYVHNVVAVDWLSDPGFVWVTYLIPERP